MSRFNFPRVRYADADGVKIAYEVRGDGVCDHVLVPGLLSGVLANHVDPIAAATADRFADFSRLISLDRRGTGLSDPLVEGTIPPLEQRVADVIAVMDAVGSRRVVLNGVGDGSQVAILCAAMYPQRLDALILSNGWARFLRSDVYPFGIDPRLASAAAQDCREHWGDIDNPWALDLLGPSRRTEPGFRETLARVQQVCASPSVAATLALADSDVTNILPLIQTPTLVLYPAEAGRDLPAHARFLAEHIPNARLESFPGADWSYGAAWEERVDLIEEFITGARHRPPSGRKLATVLFTDIVASTERAVELGDAAWRAQLDRHDAAVRDSLDRFRGREVSTAGDSFFATFDGPAQAIRCAQTIIHETSALGVDVRAGVHTGECETRGDDYGGIAVHIGARVAALAGPRQILTTSTVKDLVAGSDIAFTDCGDHQLKGVPDRWHIYEVTT